MEEIFNPVTILLHFINAAILLCALYFLLYKPVRTYTTDRATMIEKQLLNAKDIEETARQHAVASEQKLKDADREAQNIISNGAQRAHEQVQQILASVQKETDDMMAKARQDMDSMMVTAHETIADEAAALAVDIASKMLAREVKLEDHKQLVNDFVMKVG